MEFAILCDIIDAPIFCCWCYCYYCFFCLRWFSFSCSSSSWSSYSIFSFSWESKWILLVGKLEAATITPFVFMFLAGPCLIVRVNGIWGGLLDTFWAWCYCSNIDYDFSSSIKLFVSFDGLCVLKLLLLFWDYIILGLKSWEVKLLAIDPYC